MQIASFIQILILTFGTTLALASSDFTVHCRGSGTSSGRAGTVEGYLTFLGYSDADGGLHYQLDFMPAPDTRIPFEGKNMLFPSNDRDFVNGRYICGTNLNSGCVITRSQETGAQFFQMIQSGGAADLDIFFDPKLQSTQLIFTNHFRLSCTSR